MKTTEMKKETKATHYDEKMVELEVGLHIQCNKSAMGIVSVKTVGGGKSGLLLEMKDGTRFELPIIQLYR